MNVKIGLGTDYSISEKPISELQIKNTLRSAIEKGVSSFDTAHNYANGLSEKILGEVINELKLENIDVYTKIGFIDISAEIREDDEFEKILLNQYSSLSIKDIQLAPQKRHFLQPDFITQCLETSISRLSKNSLRGVLLHNPETQLIKLSRPDFESILLNAFIVLENAFRSDIIKGYGVATWQSFYLNPNDHFYISIEWLHKLANKVGGKGNGFKTIMFPLNPSFLEKSLIKNQPVQNKNMSILDAAHKLQLEVNISSPFNRGPKSIIEKKICLDLLQDMYMNHKIHKIFTTMWSNTHLLENVEMAKKFGD